jgi:hypothetical protein
MLAELSSLRDDVNVLTAIVQRLDNNHARLLSEIRATHTQVFRHGERLRRLESLAPKEDGRIERACGHSRRYRQPRG